MLRRFAAVVAASLGDIDFATDDGLDAARFRRLIKRFGGEKIAVIRDGHGGPPPAPGFGDHFFEDAGSAHKAVDPMRLPTHEPTRFHARHYSTPPPKFSTRPTPPSC